MNRDEILAAFDSWAAERKGKRGRPHEDSVAELETGMRRVVVEVFVEELKLGRHWGDRAKAIDTIIGRYARKGIALDEVNVRQAAYRHRDLRKAADLLAQLDREEKDFKELRHRMRGFPPNVRNWLGPVPALKLLKLLRAEGIDGDCPDVFIEAARGPDLMSPSRQKTGIHSKAPAKPTVRTGAKNS